MRYLILCLSSVFALTMAGTVAGHAEQVGEVGVDWLGNDIIVDAVEDPGVSGRDLSRCLF